MKEMPTCYYSFKMTPTDGDTTMRALVILLFLLSFIIRSFGVLEYSREELVEIRFSCAEWEKTADSRFNLIVKIPTQTDTGPRHAHARRERRRGKRGGVLARMRTWSKVYLYQVYA